MKTLVFTLILMTFNTFVNASTIEERFTLESITKFEKASPCTLVVGLQIIGRIGRENLCRGLSFECLKLSLFHEVSRFSPANCPEGSTQILFEKVSSDQLKLTFIADALSEKEFVVDRDTQFPLPVAKLFNVSNISIAKGKYKAAFNRDGSISVIFNIKI